MHRYVIPLSQTFKVTKNTIIWFTYYTQATKWKMKKFSWKETICLFSYWYLCYCLLCCDIISWGSEGEGETELSDDNNTVFHTFLYAQLDIRREKVVPRLKLYMNDARAIPSSHRSPCLLCFRSLTTYIRETMGFSFFRAGMEEVW